MTRPNVRCAIYTRKSSEEGLEQSFNSLEAQREACHSFILSQKHEGWTALDGHYDDGGFSGGTMERPALKRLLADIQAAKIQTVIVYKVDRLTRSLTDFSKIIEIFDSQKVSFVSVTQNFNTTSSMGRLTLNVLLSFAQFEREITGERIRDKIAASKKKGMWMGGLVPLGYDCVNRQLVINPAEAQTVLEIFRGYLRLKSVNRLKQLLDRKEVRSKIRTSRAGRTGGGATYSRGALYHLLNNRIYLGEITHRAESYPGQHQPIVPTGLWNAVAALLKKQNQSHRSEKSQSSPSLLSGKLFDSHGSRFTPTHAAKNGKRYRYYTSQAVIRQTGTRPLIARFPAEELERLVKSQVLALLRAPDMVPTAIEDGPTRDIATERVKELAREWPRLEMSKQHEFVRNTMKRVVLGPTTMTIEVDQAKVLTALLAQNSEALASLGTHKFETLKLTGDFHFRRRGCELRLVTADNASHFGGKPTMSLAKAVARAQEWHERIIAGKTNSIDQLAESSGLTRRYVRRVLLFASLSPRLVEALLTGKHRPNLTVAEILHGVPVSWREQEERFLRFE